jgi:hypothetical protein
MKTKEKYKVVERIFKDGSNCWGCVFNVRYLDDNLSATLEQCTILDTGFGIPEECPGFVNEAEMELNS